MTVNTNWLLWVSVMVVFLTSNFYLSKSASDPRSNGVTYGRYINELRQKHQVDRTHAEMEICIAAQECSRYYAEKGETDQSCEDKNRSRFRDRITGRTAGESTAILDGELEPEDAFKMAIQQWYGQVELWDFAAADAKAGHQKSECSDFTQLVWKGSVFLGLGLTTRAGKTYVVALYSPPGNYERDYKGNVLPSKE